MSVYQISVIIPTFNSSVTIKKVIDSVLSQTVLPIEIIIVDDCSNDETLSYIYKASQNNNTDVKFIILENEINRGPSFSRNRGISHSSGNWIAFLDSDDYWHPRKLEIQAQAATTLGMNFIGSKSLVLAGNKNDLEFTKLQYRLIKPWDMLWKNYFQTPTVFIKKTDDLIFDEKMSHSEDYDLWIRMVHNQKEACLITLPLTYLGKEPYLNSGLSHSLFKMEMGELSVLKREKNIFLRVAAILFSLLKYARRLIRVKLHKE